MTQYATHLFGNAGKRRAVEQFFQLILQEKEPQTLLLFSDENMEWMYEDPQFAKRWTMLFLKVLEKGNRVKIIHTVNRGMNEILEAVMKWVPIYMTGAIEPYFYPPLRDDLFQHTLFIAPKTAAVVSVSVQQQTEGMLNEFITDKDALEALVKQYDRHFALCSPLMQIITEKNLSDLVYQMRGIDGLAGETTIRCVMPPLFALPKLLVEELDNAPLYQLWMESVELFERRVMHENVHLILQDPARTLANPQQLVLYEGGFHGLEQIQLTPAQYKRILVHLRQLTEKYPRLEVRQQSESLAHTYLYVKENGGVVMAKTDAPVAAFIIREQNMQYAFVDYSRRNFEASEPLSWPTD